MESKLEYKTSKFKDWTELELLSPEQVRQLIREKIERAKMYSHAMLMLKEAE